MSKYEIIAHCQACGNKTEEIMSLGDLPLVDALEEPKPHKIHHTEKYPAPFLFCPTCQLFQLGCIVDQKLLFPVNYPYTSATTKQLCDNFTELCKECGGFLPLNSRDLVVDIGCNDGTLLSNFKNHCRVVGITPENIGDQARQKGIPVLQSYFTPGIVKKVISQFGQAQLITATNVLAHFPNIHDALASILELLDKKGVFVSESGYLPALIGNLQYDTIHHEHLRYYTVTSLNFIFQAHNMEIIHAKKIPPHGGSIRVYAARKGLFPATDNTATLLREEENGALSKSKLQKFKLHVIESKQRLRDLLTTLKKDGMKIYGVGAPGRATVLINFAGIDEKIISCALEVTGSHKIGKRIPGTKIAILEEKKLFIDQPDYALLLSWHIAKELMPKIKTRGFRGDFIIPLPTPTIVRNRDVQ